MSLTEKARELLSGKYTTTTDGYRMALEGYLLAALDVVEAAEEFVSDSYRPTAKYDGVRFDIVRDALAKFKEVSR